ncbi:carboxypeptidase-like regulatory domain-containing protein [Aporhodopirellula aestuarii]|uniref:Carboxypeptidase-like regulatory domain-containing protein n=1 Tax=Aporhodopirellula aestuarii TaxID=2950107 RepID=A0ABT0UD74_9BACT|nr:carboxypeptidase-like regulatory domain-containing protein [Aporhodopirellula aestuarii]MCM2374989.1 carboxypeptidase-like regulatory domain-containing protein [Aporhodopirellula aestuarii]
MNLSTRWFSLSIPFLAITALAVSGCDVQSGADYSSLGLIPISGEVTLDNEPLSGAVVFFEAPDLTQAYATTDQEGRYTIKFNSEIEGVTPGTKIVRISTTASTGEGSEEADEDGDEDGAPARRFTRGKKDTPHPGERVPSQYNKKSTLTVEVTSNDSIVNFHLKSDGSSVTPQKS